MKFINPVLIAALSVSFAGFSANVRSADTKTATFTINATFTAPSCDISIPTQFYSLGTLTPGAAKKHSPLEIKWTCAGNIPVKTAIKGSVSQGQLESSNDKLQMLLTKDGKPNGTYLWLENNNTPVKLTGLDSDAFCSDSTAATGERQCVITPVTEVHNTDQFGPVKAAVTFEVIYP
ncbi:fimbrial protein [Escherichia sp. E3659]|uniref:hypothetical protein n=1 Tax=Escherichia TaxID=561 RepID=UPI0002A2A776|nr:MULTISPECIES: hypothetical protein [Escherichia]ELG84978.1 hypothetical protein A311_04620 [Escherichia coli KTE146]ELG86389.1 hypothetical protein A311_03704 [Escherichia coli KTE146]TGB81364.1 fimbrial protein [Escherichia sp. E3659]TLJ11629.1 fimbrial protein [Escherichia sp. E3659]